MSELRMKPSALIVPPASVAGPSTTTSSNAESVLPVISSAPLGQIFTPRPDALTLHSAPALRIRSPAPPARMVPPPTKME